MKLVRVTWHDASDQKETWLKDADIDDEPYEVVSVGFVVRDTPKYLTLAADTCPGDETPTWGRVTKIPHGMVQRVEVLEGGE